MNSMGPKDVYRLTIGALLHEVCRELLDGEEIHQELLRRREELAELDEETDEVAMHEFAAEQVLLRRDRYRKLGELVDEVIDLYEDLQGELYEDGCLCEEEGPWLDDDFEAADEYEEEWEDGELPEDFEPVGEDEYEEVRDEEPEPVEEIVLRKKKKKSKNKKGKKEKKKAKK